MNILNSSSCTFCKNFKTETIEHLFSDCIHVKEIWFKIKEQMLNQFHISVCFNIEYLSCLENVQIKTIIDFRIYLFKQHSFASK